MFVDVVRLLATGLFAGAAVHVSLVMQASLAALTGVAGIGDWARGHGALPLLAGLAMVVLIAFTLTVILPTNKRLMDPTLDAGGVEAAALLLRWGRPHAVRTAGGLTVLLPVGLHRAGAS